MFESSLHHVRRRGALFLALWLGFGGGLLAACGGSVLQAASGIRPGSTAIASGAAVPVPADDKYREQAINKVGPAIVEVKTNQGLGSGVIIRSDGYIVTNHHVIAGASRITVTLANGRTVSGTVRGSDAVDDLAVVKVRASGLPAASFGDSSRLQVGQSVLAIGNPLGITHVVTSGIVSALNRTVSEGQGGGSIPNAIETSAPINPGNSGGALVNLAGQVVGIPTLTAVDPEFNAPAPGIGFAIPSNHVNAIAAQIIKTRKVTHTGRAALGVYVLSMTPDLASQYGLPVSHGVLIARVQPGGGAARAGIKKNDTIIKVDRRNIRSESDLLDVLANRSPGNTVKVTVVTPSGQHKTYTVKLGELSATAQ